MSTYSEILDELKNIKEENLNQEFVITFCGIFSSGKSSVINCLLDYDGFALPTGINPLTKLVTRIKYGENLQFYYKTNGKKTYLSKTEFEKFTTGEKSLPKNCMEMNIEIPSKLLRSGLVILDSPGFEDEMGGELEACSRRAILQGDLVVICTSALYFGNMFEQELMAEVQKSHGGFVLLVNRMDGLNTQKDLWSVKIRAHRLFNVFEEERTEKLLIKDLFFTVAAGHFTELDGLPFVLSFLASNDKRMANIKKHAFLCKKTVAIEELYSKINILLQSEQEKLKSVQAKDCERRKELELQYIEENIKRQSKTIAMKSRYEIKLNAYLEKIYKDIKMLEEDGRWKNFSSTAKTFLNIHMKYLMQDIKYDFCNDEETSKLLALLKARVEYFAIPAPIAKKVKTRGLFQRFEKTLKFTKETGNIRFDDGVDLIFENYADPAIELIECNLKPNLKKLINQIIDLRYAPINMNELDIGFNKEINDIENKIQSLICCERELRQYNICRLIKDLTAVIYSG